MRWLCAQYGTSTRSELEWTAALRSKGVGVRVKQLPHTISAPYSKPRAEGATRTSDFVYFQPGKKRSSSHDIRAAFCTGKSALDVNPISVKGTTAGFAANAGLVMTSEVMANIGRRGCASGRALDTVADAT